jgi:hypothetical protein
MADVFAFKLLADNLFGNVFQMLPAKGNGSQQNGYRLPVCWQYCKNQTTKSRKM